jgi:PadR family transcriptional regulator PadR
MIQGTESVPLDGLGKHVFYSFQRLSRGECPRHGLTSMAVRRIDLLQGTLDLLILKSLGTGPNHGYGIAMRLHELSDDVLKVEEGSLYPALYRMEEQGLIDSEWRTTENNRKAKFYQLTRKGRSAAQAELEGWLRLSGAVTRVLRAIEQGA